MAKNLMEMGVISLVNMTSNIFVNIFYPTFTAYG